MDSLDRTLRWPCAGLLCALLALVTCASAAAEEDRLPPAANDLVDFARDIRPLFEKHCLKCHGKSKQLSGFRLDREGDALRGGDAGAAYEAGRSADSLLIRYVAGLDPDVIMPPEGAKLTSDEVGLLRGWIDQGAKWSEGADSERAGTRSGHWSFQPVRRPAAPGVSDAGRVRNAIDAFVLARLDQEGIAPSDAADRRTLIRRLSLDLVGLPPTPAEVEAFVRDEGEDASERVVERLLASPQFGERWARHWLDLARYADSDGYEKDNPRPHAWRYRHWLIEALNADLPFDRFTIEQIAGDLLPEGTLDQKIATGFHRNTLTNTEGGVDKEEFRVAAVVDRVNTTASVWLGLTLGCAQCHSHKYDPLTLREYYGLFAFFNQGQEVDVAAPLPQEAADYAVAKAAYDAAHAPFLSAIAEFERTQLPARQAEWERTFDRSALVAWRVLEAASVAATGEVTLTRQPDGSYLASGARPPTATYTLTFPLPADDVTALRLEMLTDASLPAKGPGRAANGNFVLSELSVTASAADGGSQPVALEQPAADFAQDGFTIGAALDGDPKTGWAVAPQMGSSHKAVFQIRRNDSPGEPPPADRDAHTLTVTLVQEHGEQHTLGRFRLSATSAARPVPLDSLPDDVVPVLTQRAADRSPEQQARLASYYATIDPELAKLRQAEADHAQRAPPPPATRAQTLADVAEPRATHIHLRGDFLRPGDRVGPHVPEVLPRLAAEGGRALTRLELAQWLVSSENPLTPRVTVNRVWKHLFGQALVTTLEDFGTRGERPSHPELLDWLAAEFVKPSDMAEGPTGWSLKRLIRLIVNSAAYRQASAPREDLFERDPRNVLLARQNRFRVEAEILRDACLASSGLLAPAIGGPSVRPRQPAGIAELTYAGSARWVESAGADRFRRGVYTWFQRTSPYPMLMTFDAPESNVTCARRERSNTPLQALTLLNDPVFHECAQALGRTMLREQPEDVAARVTGGFERCVSRPPTEDELARLLALHAALREAAASDQDAAAQLAGEPRPAESALPEAAAAVALARILLNLDEFVTRE